MIDFWDGIEIFLVSVLDGKGNYYVFDGKYGVRKGELFCLDCFIGKVLGIVKE